MLELHKRRPQDQAIRFDLAICSTKVAVGITGQRQWGAARKQFAQAAHHLDKAGSELAAAVAVWRDEAAYREACQNLQTKKRNQAGLISVCQLLEAGCRHAPDQPRWWFGAGIAYALAGDYASSAEYLAQARARQPEHRPTQLALALSWQASENGARARQVFHELLAQPVSGEDGAAAETLAVATRFALAMSYARDRSWKEAASTLQPLLEHPLIVSSDRVTPSDVASASVAWLAAGGERESASKLARQYLQDTHGLEDVLIGLVQADAGDFQGAEAALGPAFAKHRDPPSARC